MGRVGHIPCTGYGEEPELLLVSVNVNKLSDMLLSSTSGGGLTMGTIALSFLMGPALSWFEPRLFNSSPPTWVNNWDLFHAELESNFSPFDPVRETEAKIETLVMAEGSHSMTYFVEFNCLAPRIQWSDHALLQQAYKGLACCIKNEMVHHNWPITLLDLRNSVGEVWSQTDWNPV